MNTDLIDALRTLADSMEHDEDSTADALALACDLIDDAARFEWDMRCHARATALWQAMRDINAARVTVDVR